MQPSYAEQAAGLSCTMPHILKVDGRDFDYYLQRENVGFESESQSGGGEPNMEVYYFDSLRDMERARVIWKCLTGCDILGVIQHWKSWKEFM